jgi:serine/threonine protein kinase
MTGGVGTTFYRAPEQEGNAVTSKGDSSYTVQADIFSLGIILFEMFSPPFSTYMERAEMLTALRGDRSPSSHTTSLAGKEISVSTCTKGDLDNRTVGRFPDYFVETTPENLRR